MKRCLEIVKVCWGYFQRRLTYGTITVGKTQLNGTVGELDETYFQRESQTVGISIVGATGYGHWTPSSLSYLCGLKQTSRGLPSFGITPRLLCLLDFGISQLLSLCLSGVYLLSSDSQASNHVTNPIQYTYSLGSIPLENSNTSCFLNNS